MLGGNALQIALAVVKGPKKAPKTCLDAHEPDVNFLYAAPKAMSARHHLTRGYSPVCLYQSRGGERDDGQ